jgi:hypothetical protein
MIGKIKEYRANQLKDILKDPIRYFSVPFGGQLALQGLWLSQNQQHRYSCHMLT